MDKKTDIQKIISDFYVAIAKLGAKAIACKEPQLEEIERRLSILKDQYYFLIENKIKGTKKTDITKIINDLYIAIANLGAIAITCREYELEEIERRIIILKDQYYFLTEQKIK